MNTRFKLRTYFIVIAAIACCIALLANWHARSMRQYRALTVGGPNDGIWIAEFSCDLEVDSQTGVWRTSSGSRFTAVATQAWLCQYFDPMYACNCVVAFGPEHGLSNFEFVANLKGVEWIVLRSPPDIDNLPEWKTRFPRSEVLSSNEWQQLETKPNTQE